MLKFNEANPLAVFGIRRLNHCPPHFTAVDFDLSAKEKTILDWIWENTESRFFMGDTWMQEKPIRMKKRVAFEDPGEAGYFALLLDTINRQ
jgi:hypothetical protein